MTLKISDGIKDDKCIISFNMEQFTDVISIKTICFMMKYIDDNINI